MRKANLRVAAHRADVLVAVAVAKEQKAQREAEAAREEEELEQGRKEFAEKLAAKVEKEEQPVAQQPEEPEEQPELEPTSDTSEDEDESLADNAGPEEATADSAPEEPAEASDHDAQKSDAVLSPESLAGTRFRAVAKGAVRAGAALDSDKIGVLKIGDVIEVSEALKVDGDITRVKFAAAKESSLAEGWTSLTARSGKELLEKAADDATVSSIVLEQSEAQKEAKAKEAEEEAEAFLAAQQAAQQLDKTYEIKQKRNKVSVQLSPMALVVTQGKKPPTSYLYQTLQSWATMDKGFEVTPASGDTIEFTCTEEDAEEICGAMTKAAKKRESSLHPVAPPTAHFDLVRTACLVRGSNIYWASQ